MTEAEWLACADPRPMLDAVWWQSSGRKKRLFACTCTRRIWHLLPSESCRKAVSIAECHADGLATDDQLTEAENEAERVFRQTDCEDAISLAAYIAVIQLTGHPIDPYATVRGTCDEVLRALNGGEEVGGDEVEEPILGQFCRDIFGNPFRPVTIDPEWLTSTVVALARGIYDERAFDRLPILADALQDAGCEQPDLLDHCRGPGPHARGCWVVDLILGKE